MTAVVGWETSYRRDSQPPTVRVKSMPPATHFALIRDEYQASLAAPLSARRVLLVAVLLDHLPDRIFAAFRNTAPEKLGHAEDVVAFRTKLRTQSRALGTIFDLCTPHPDGPALRTIAIEVPIADYPGLRVEDYMVSLYNQNTVQRVVIAWPDGRQALAHDVLAEAMAWWEAEITQLGA
jgi:hypothetical protein